MSTEAQLADLDELREKVSGRVNELKTKIIPNKMAEVGLSEFATPEGHKLKVDDFVAGSLPKEPEARAKAVQALEALGGGDIIKSELLVSFDKKEHNQAMALLDDLRKQGFVNSEVTSGVHASTYCAFIKEALRSGAEVNPETLGVFVGMKAKLTLKKEKPAKAGTVKAAGGKR